MTEYVTPMPLDELEPVVVPEMTDGPLRRKIQGVLCFRLILAVFFLVLTMAVESRRDSDLLSVHLQPLYFFSCILFLFTIVAALSLKRARNLKRFGYIQLYFDVGAVTFLVYLSGGVESPYHFLYTPVILCAALLHYRRGSVLVASACALAYGLTLDLQYFGWISPLQIISEAGHSKDSGAYFHSIIMSIAAFYLVAFLSGYLSEELQKSSRKIQLQKRDLQKLELLHRNIVHSMNSGLVTISPTGYIRFANRAAEEILGMSPDLILGRAFHKVFPPLDPLTWPSNTTTLRNAQSPESMSRKEVAYKRPAGEKLSLGYTVSVLQGGENQEGAGWLFLFQDLTTFKAMEEHIQRMERVAFAGRIAAEIAHEIKNPLAAMSGAIQMLQAEAQRDSLQQRLMNIVDREINRIDDLVTDFLWLTRGVRKPAEIEDVPVCSVIQEIISLLDAKEKIGPSQRVRTTFECTPSIVMDPHHFRQVLWNLLVNALEATPEGGDVDIRVCTSEGFKSGWSQAQIDIRDTGCGIPDDLRGRIFEPFFTTKKSGTGLGLSIVYQLVETAKGRITVAQNTESGSTFSLFFPLSPAFTLAKQA